MPYVNITLNLGAAVPAYKVVWNYPNILKNVIIHLGDFHIVKEAFAFLGMLKLSLFLECWDPDSRISLFSLEYL